MAACTAPTSRSAQSADVRSPVSASAIPSATPAVSASLSPAPLPPPSTAPTPIALPTFTQLSVPSSSVIWALVAGSRLFRSEDRGDTWEERTIPTNATNIRISFLDGRDGWLLSGGSGQTPCPTETATIWRTSDGAATWKDTGTAGIAEAGCKSGISVVSPTIGFVGLAGEEQVGSMYRTSDGGRSWASVGALPDPPGVSRTADARYWTGPVHRFGPVLLVTLERQAAAGGTIFVYRSLDEGRSWAYLATLPRAFRPGFITATRWAQLLVPGQSQETTDAGATWHSLASDYGQAAPYAPQVEFGDAQTGYATVRGAIQRSLDGAAHWTGLHTPGTR